MPIDTTRHLCFDLHPGDVFTVRSFIQPSPPTGDYGGQSLFIPNIRPSGLFPGLPLRFRALDYPFILCAVINQAGVDTLQTVLDVRTHSIQRLSPAYIEAMTAFTPPHSSPPIPEMPGCPDIPPPTSLP